MQDLVGDQTSVKILHNFVCQEKQKILALEIQEKQDLTKKFKICGFGGKILARNGKKNFLRKLGKKLLFSQLPYTLHAG